MTYLGEYEVRRALHAIVFGRAGARVAAETTERVRGLAGALVDDELHVGLGRCLDALLDGLVQGEVVSGKHRKRVPCRARGRHTHLALRVDAERRDGVERGVGELRQLGEMHAAYDVVEGGRVLFEREACRALGRRGDGSERAHQRHGDEVWQGALLGCNREHRDT